MWDVVRDAMESLQAPNRARQWELFPDEIGIEACLGFVLQSLRALATQPEWRVYPVITVGPIPSSRLFAVIAQIAGRLPDFPFLQSVRKVRAGKYAQALPLCESAKWWQEHRNSAFVAW